MSRYACRARTLHSVAGWTEQGDPQYDYGAIGLDCTVGDQTGTLILERNGGGVDNRTKYLAGYSGDKGGATQWIRSGTVNGWNAFRLSYDLDTVGGDSGAPLYRVGGDCRDVCVLAINSWEYYVSDNYGVRIRDPMLRFFAAWTGRQYMPAVFK